MLVKTETKAELSKINKPWRFYRRYLMLFDNVSTHAIGDRFRELALSSAGHRNTKCEIIAKQLFQYLKGIPKLVVAIRGVKGQVSFRQVHLPKRDRDTKAFVSLIASEISEMYSRLGSRLVFKAVANIRQRAEIYGFLIATALTKFFESRHPKTHVVLPPPPPYLLYQPSDIHESSFARGLHEAKSAAMTRLIHTAPYLQVLENAVLKTIRNAPNNRHAEYARIVAAYVERESNTSLARELFEDRSKSRQAAVTKTYVELAKNGLMNADLSEWLAIEWRMPVEVVAQCRNLIERASRAWQFAS
jgi:hypothetical protein